MVSRMAAIDWVSRCQLIAFEEIQNSLSACAVAECPMGAMAAVVKDVRAGWRNVVEVKNVVKFKRRLCVEGATSVLVGSCRRSGSLPLEGEWYISARDYLTRRCRYMC